MQPTNRIDHTLATLLIIDMQVGMTWPKAEVRNNHQAEATIAKLLAAWRDRKAPVVHVRHISRTPGSPFWPGQPGVEFQPELAPLPHEHVVEKNVPDAFLNTGLERSADDVHAMALANLDGEYATVIRSEDALDAEPSSAQ